MPLVYKQRQIYFTLMDFNEALEQVHKAYMNIGGVGSSGVGHVHFMYIACCLCNFFRVGNAKISRRKGRFQWNTGLSLHGLHLLFAACFGDEDMCTSCGSETTGRLYIEEGKKCISKCIII